MEVTDVSYTVHALHVCMCVHSRGPWPADPVTHPLRQVLDSVLPPSLQTSGVLCHTVVVRRIQAPTP